MPPKAPKETPLTPELAEQLEDLTARHRSSEEATTVDEWKALGNACFSHGSYLTAIKCYTKPIADMPNGDTAVLRSNRSAAYLKSSMLSGPALSLKDAEKAVELRPEWFKGYLRVGDAQFARKKYEEAEAAYERALALDRTCEAATFSLKALRKEMFLRDLDVREKERRKVEEEEMERLRGTGEYEAAANHWAEVNVNSSLNTTYRRAAEKDDEPSEKRPFEFHNAPLRFALGGDGEEEEDEAPPLHGLSSAGRYPTRHNNPRSRRPPREEETEELIRTWKRDLVPYEEDAEDTKAPQQAHSALSRGNQQLTVAHSNAVVTTSGSSAGSAYKAQLLGQFRHKVENDAAFSQTLQAKRAEELKKGEKVDYREGDRFRRVYAKATNGIGLGISADSYKEYTGTEDRSLW